MRDIDGYAYLSKLRKLLPQQKVFLSMSLLVMCLSIRSLALYTAVMAMMLYGIVVKGGTPLKLVLKLMCIPMGFLVLSILTILFQFTSDHTVLVVAIPIGKSYIGFSLQGVQECFLLFFKVMASISCLYFLSLTTPLTDLLGVMKKLRCPLFLIELMMLIYRFIFVLMDVAYTMQYAQSSRLGYRNLKTGLKSFGLLLSTVLVKAIKINNDLYTALEARGYNGELKVLSQEGYWAMSYWKIVGLQVGLIAMSFIERSIF